MRRRDLLQSGSLALVGTTIALAGCSSDGDDGDDEDDEDDGGGSSAIAESCAEGIGVPEDPSANFSIVYSGRPIGGTDTDGHAVVTHASGDTLDACTLLFEGSGVAPVGGGRWDQQYVSTDGRRLTPTTDDDYAVAAGEEVYVPADADFEMVLRWESPGPGGGSEKLAEESGPDA